MSKPFDDLLSVAEYKKKVASLEKELKATYKTIDKLLKDNKLKEEEISHLKSLLEKNVPVLIEDKKPQQLIQLDLSPEEEIAEIQLNKLKEASKNRALTLEEARIYDLLVKNKRLSRKESTVNIENAAYKEISVIELMKVAGKSDDSDSTK